MCCFFFFFKQKAAYELRIRDWSAAVCSSDLRDYFRLRKPLERRIYELARKHCGAQEKWSISVETLQKKTGASSHLRVFRSMLRDLVAHDHLPDYAVEMNGDTVTFRNRE